MHLFTYTLSFKAVETVVWGGIVQVFSTVNILSFLFNTTLQCLLAQSSWRLYFWWQTQHSFPKPGISKVFLESFFPQLQGLKFPSSLDVLFFSLDDCLVVRTAEVSNLPISNPTIISTDNLVANITTQAIKAGKRSKHTGTGDTRNGHQSSLCQKIQFHLNCKNRSIANSGYTVPYCVCCYTCITYLYGKCEL